MIDRKHIENVLRANGVPPSADDEQIRSVLLSAKWDKNEVDTALTVLKENTTNHETHVDVLHKVFRSDDTLSPQEISALLGIDVKMPATKAEPTRLDAKIPISQSTIILLASFIIAFVSLTYVMYSQKMGPFYEASAHDVPTETTSE